MTTQTQSVAPATGPSRPFPDAPYWNNTPFDRAVEGLYADVQSHPLTTGYRRAAQRAAAGDIVAAAQVDCPQLTAGTHKQAQSRLWSVGCLVEMIDHHLALVELSQCRFGSAEEADDATERDRVQVFGWHGMMKYLSVEVDDPDGAIEATWPGAIASYNQMWEQAERINELLPDFRTVLRNRLTATVDRIDLADPGPLKFVVVPHTVYHEVPLTWMFHSAVIDFRQRVMLLPDKVIAGKWETGDGTQTQFRTVPSDVDPDELCQVISTMVPQSSDADADTVVQAALNLLRTDHRQR